MKYTAQDAIKFIQAFGAGKKIRGSYKKEETFFEIESLHQLGGCLFDVDAKFTLTLAPEPKELCFIVDNNGESVKVIHKATAESTCEEWDEEFPHNAPHIVENYVQVLP